MPAPPAPFLYILKTSVAGAFGCGAVTGAWHIVLEACGVDYDDEVEEMKEEYGWLPEAQAVDAAKAAAEGGAGLPGATFIHPTDAGHRAGLVETTPDTPGTAALPYVSTATRRYQRGRRVARRPMTLHTLWAATTGSAAGVLAGVPLAAGAFHLAPAAAVLAGLKAAAFWSPLWGLEALMGPKHVARNLPWYTGALFLVTAPLVTLAPIAGAVSVKGAAVAKSTILSGLRIVAHGQGAVLIFAFVNRYSTVQASKPLLEDTSAVGSHTVVRVVNFLAVTLGRLAGNMSAGVWFYLAMVDVPGNMMLSSATWLPCYTYILVTQVHLSAPLSGHDRAGSTEMLRQACVGLASTAVAVPSAHFAPLAVNFAMRGVVFACFAGWIMTFGNEWARLQRRSMRQLLHTTVGRCSDSGLLLLYFGKWAHAAGYQMTYSDKLGRWEWTPFTTTYRVRRAIVGQEGPQEQLGGVRFGEGNRDYL